MRQSVLHARIPNIFGLLLLVALVFGTIMLVKTGVLFPIRATVNDQPKAVQITNITDKSFTVTYVTEEQVVGSVTYGESETFGTVSLDERDTAGNNAQPHKVHAITINNVKPQTKYYFAIISGSSTFSNSGSAYSVTTAATPKTVPPAQDPVSGTLIKPDGEKPLEAIVYVSTDGSQTISAFAKADGTYTVPINTLLDEQLTNYMSLNDQTLLHINVVGDGMLANVKVTKDKSNQIPQITLGQDYDFTLAGGEDSMPVASDSADTNQTLPKFSVDKHINTNPQILTPQRDETLSDQQPKFTGTAPPNRTVEIVIHSTQEIRATVRTDQSGAWSFRPGKPLTPGTHTIQITTKDEAGFTRTLVQSFVVNAQGSQFTEPSVSPIKSPTPTPTRVPTPTPTPRVTLVPTATKTPTPTIRVTSGASPTTQPSTGASPTISPSVVPSIVPSSVLSPTIQPTATIFPRITPAPTTILPTGVIVSPTQAIKPTITSPGSNEVIATVSIAAVAMISGAVLFFLTQGGM